MHRFVIDGGTPLESEITISGAKNAVLPIFAATLLADGPCLISNVPELRDVTTMLKVLEKLGCRWEQEGPGTIRIDPRDVRCYDAPYDLVKTMRASFIVLGPLLTKYGSARVSMPGGCAIGVRQVDLHLKGLAVMGARIETDEGYVKATCSRLRGAEVYLDFPSVGATENIMLAATLAEGITIIKNAALEPEIADLATFLNAMGAKITGAGGSVIEITGVTSLLGANHRVIPDRIETGTYAVAAAITRGQLLLKDAPVSMIESVIAKLQESGVEVAPRDTGLLVKGPAQIRPVDLTTQPHPGFPTDLQAPFMAYLTLAAGSSTISERIFENRFLHVAELRRMGADARVQSTSGTVIHGVDHLSGAQVMAGDLRGGASLVLAALAARGRSEVSRVYHIDRGYVRMEEKLGRVGARIRREDDRAPETRPGQP
ncbi:MAG: UDP-N-acetylglucosamine 1-carboxyvinyltransferase [Candidatus Riflebacteria bacterium]|nr:UDP-N-acetylglucosamine 1-carboxyvinyltransferase [Candidatus Riflebacteria bacterium]